MGGAENIASTLFWRRRVAGCGAGYGRNLFLGLSGGRLRLGKERKGRIGRKACQQDAAFDRRDLAVPAQPAEQNRCPGQDGALAAYYAPDDPHREDQRRHRQDQQQVRDVASDDIADDDVVMTGQHRAD